MRIRPLHALCALWLAAASAGAARAGVSIYLSPEALAARAPVAFEGSVTAVDTGYDPVTARIATYVTVDVARVLRGALASGPVVLREHGGVFGEVVHESEAAPSYHPGERVLVFAEPARDGSLRTAAGFFGKFEVIDAPGQPSALERRLSGRGLILRGPAEPDERFARERLERSLSALGPEMSAQRCADTGCRREPLELERLIWNSKLPRTTSAPAASERGAQPSGTLARTIPFDAPTRTEFVSLSPSNPARWDEMDAGGTIAIDVDRARDPLGNAEASVAEIGRALGAWNAIAESRASLRLGNVNANFTFANPYSPADVYPPANIVLFGDPYDDLSDPVACSGTLAYGGYWRSGSPGRVVNGVQYFPIRRAYVIFNRNFECFLGVAANLAEVAAHELGHGLGFGHSSVPDSVMRSWPYGGRGATLGNDDRNAALCSYPHTFVLLQPNGGENWKAGSTQSVRWSSTLDAASSPGTVDLELSSDAGARWSTIVTGTPNDGLFEWVVPATPSSQARVRVVRRTLFVSGGSIPTVCTQDASNASFSVLPPAPGPGAVPELGNGALTLARSASGGIDLSWGAACGAPSGYVVYEGTLDALAAGVWDHHPVRCGSGPALTQSVAAAGGHRYYLVAATGAASESPLGAGSQGTLRPQSSSACAPRATASCP